MVAKATLYSMPVQARGGDAELLAGLEVWHTNSSRRSSLSGFRVQGLGVLGFTGF